MGKCRNIEQRRRGTPGERGGVQESEGLTSELEKHLQNSFCCMGVQSDARVMQPQVHICKLLLMHA